MNKRSIQIIRLLCEEQPSKMKELEDQLQVSARTLRNDLRSINDFLEARGLHSLTVKSGQIQVPPDFERAAEILRKEIASDYRLSTSERAAAAACMLASDSGYKTLASLAERLSISRQTIIKDLPLIRSLIESFGIQVISQANKGLRLEGEESHLRWMLFTLYEKASETARYYMHVQMGNTGLISRILKEQEIAFGCTFRDDSFESLKQKLGLISSRILQGMFVEPCEPSKNEEHIQMAGAIMNGIEQYMDLDTEIPKAEASHLSLLLDECQFLERREASSEAVRVQILTRSFIREISRETGMNLNRDYTFFENLSNHILSVLTQKDPKYPDAGLLQDVIEENREIFLAAKKYAYILEGFAGRPLNDSDISFICIHILAAIEKYRSRSQKLKVALVCHGGVGTSQYLAEKIQRFFDFHVVRTLSAHHADQIQPGQADLIITTVPLPTLPVESVLISPLFNDDDYIRILSVADQVRTNLFQARIAQAGGSGYESASLIRLLEPVIQELGGEHKVELSRAIRRIVRDFFREPQERQKDLASPWLHHLLHPGRIQLDVEASDWKDAIRKASAPLLKAGSIESRYVDNMIESIMVNGPYIVLVPGFAMPHDASDAGAVRTDLNLIRLKHPVNFDHEAHDPVRYVCVLSAPDHKTHLKAFFNLVNLIQQPDFLARLDQAKTPEELASVIEHAEYALPAQ